MFASHADRVEVCLVEGDGSVSRTVHLPERTEGVWHGFLPDVRPGQRYGLRVHGAWDPDRGHRHNPAKLLLDPYARAVEGEIAWSQGVFGHAVDESLHPVDGEARHGGTRRLDASDSLGHVPLGVVTQAPVADGARRPRVPWGDTVVYEAHLRGLTARHPDVPAELRGTWAGLAHPAVVGYLVDLGVTAVELLPVFAIGDEPALVRRGMRNYWGYSTLSFFAPEPRYATEAARAGGGAAVVAEVAAAVEALHDAGLEVLLDVVYNHTCEGGAAGPTLSFRGIDNASYYRLDDHGRDVDVTGCGNTLDFSHPRVVQLALDSLRYWVQAYGVDGFRFDLAPALARGGSAHGDAYDPDHPFLVATRTDPVLCDAKLVAEPWDLGTHGWRTGQFPPPWAEWNDRFRDDVRTFWLADAAPHRAGGTSELRHVATRLAGSSDHFGTSASADRVERPNSASVNFATAHDGFTLADALAYEHKHNEANGENNSDGSSDNRTWNHGVEGDTDDEAVLAARAGSARAVLATLVLAVGTPMVTAGDELGRTQRGNNNAYCLDDETVWVDWATADTDLTAHVRALLRLRRDQPVLRQGRRFTGRPVHADGTTDLAWFAPDGALMDSERWHDHDLRTLQMYLHGGDAGGDSLLVVVNGSAHPVPVRLPAGPWATGYTMLWTSATASPVDPPEASLTPGDLRTSPQRSVQVLRADAG